MKFVLTAATFILAWLFSVNDLHAQDSLKTSFTNCDSMEAIQLRKGDVFEVHCESALIFNAKAYRKLLGAQSKNEELLRLLEERVSVVDSLTAIKDRIITRLEKIDAIQNKTYDSLLVKFNRADKLVKGATKNTEDALKLITRIKLANYATSGLLGGVAGGLIVGSVENGDKSGVRFNLVGAGVGLVGGIFLNHWLLTKI